MPASSNSRFQLRATIAKALKLVTARVAAALAAIAHSIHPSADNAWLIDGELRLYRQGTRYSPYSLIAGALFVSLACAAWVPWTTRMTWSLAVAIVSVGVDFMSRRLEPVDGDSLARIRLRARWYVGMTAVFTAIWCSMSVFLWVPEAPLDHMVIVLILACSLAGSIALNAMHPPIAIVTFAIHAGFLIGPLALSHAPLDHTLANLSLVFILLMAGQLVSMNATMTKTLTLEHERGSLVDGLLRAKAEFDHEHERATAASRAKSQFLSNMSHELRTPMNAILGFSELMRNKALGNAVDKYPEYAAIIHESGKHLLDLIDDMLDLAKIEGGRMSLRDAEVSLADLIADAVESNRPAADRSHLSLTRRIAPDFPSLVADERALRQIVANLLSNAVKFTPPGGCVTAFAHVEADGRIAFGVEDTGIGIAEEDQATVFERFGKGRHDVTMADKGTGLGLAVVKGFAEAHDGSVLLESALGSGTRVTVYLPASRACTEEMLCKEAS